MSNDPQYRYPGLEPFRLEQRAQFFGRKADLERLSELVDLHQQVLLYAKSGLGKSSLINAGLIPRLQDHAVESGTNIRILPVRIHTWVNAQSNTPLEVLHAELGPVAATFLDRIIENEGSLWYHFKAATMAAEGNSCTFYLIFDQFEELFSHPESSIAAFKSQLADVLYRAVPQYFRSSLEMMLQDDPNLLSAAELQKFYAAIQVKVLYAIREDRYSDLNRLADHLPDFLQNRFQLSPLGRQQAEEAIVAPAQLIGNYVTAPFTYAPEALDKILDYLSSGGRQSVETTQLQILCSHIERLGKSVVTLEDVPKFDDIFLQFYLDSIACLDLEDQARTREFIEEYMIIDEHRIAYHERACLERVHERALERLLKERHLLRTESNSTGVYYELSHDTLVGPILSAKKERLALEAENAERAARHEAELLRAEQERLRNLEEQRLRTELEKERLAREAEKRQLRRTRGFLLVSIVCVVSALVAFCVALSSKWEAEHAKDLAQGFADSLRTLQEKTQRIINANSFYAGRYGLAVKDTVGGKLYGYIDEGGNITIDYQYREAWPFDMRNGYARVKKDTIDFLIDTNNVRMRLAYSLEQQSDTTIEAVDLRGYRTGRLPRQFPPHWHVKVLLMSQMGLDSIPDGIADWASVEMLDLSENRLDSFPAELGALDALKVLYLPQNKLPALPDGIAGCEQLIRLDLSENLLESISPAIGTLSNLELLDLSQNRLTELPNEVAALTNLAGLDLFNNQIRSLPSDIGSMHSLKALRLGYNGLIGLPRSFENLDQLETLDLTANKLLTLPDAIKGLENLRELHLGRNPCSNTEDKRNRIRSKVADWLPGCFVSFD